MCKHCSLESESLARQIARRRGWLYLLVRPGVGAGLLALVFMLMGGTLAGLVSGLLLGGLLGMAYQGLYREKRFR
ncbi:MAG: hypothetical protein Q8K34_17690 [Hydrogenophaga sp.]|jgi:predicted lipid-binding transport protein (Tim44 family)|uniref:hypothetical protein n=1 Tax=Hydrogenophaga sp. TaxID=1904254 RepID=UPI0027280D97|nr:hypothetical protein [Hydrogenophaga sp.]MDO9201755.1 hypothetical protein [Hydrogenophaga sp.]MDO9482578.1 hypothetical protein [Hydrogenophaga sp.]MDO9568998.1 hypothetical protein [Hydrogenophaga sp.]MDP1894549.1 hypothetical protein [Hydrogenophaga sp.]MDP2093348.1 hypothetical protein [Hydrogenophaga sp.]